MKNNKGFTLIEMLGCLALLGIVLVIGLVSTKGTFSTTNTMLNKISDNEIFESAKAYAIENNSWTRQDETEFVCVTIKNLVDYGYISNDNNNLDLEKLIKVFRDMTLKNINAVKYVDECL